MGKSEAARTFGVSLSSVKRYVSTARQGRPLTPKKRPGLHPKIDEQGKKLLQADLQERPAATLPQRREVLQRGAGVRVSGSTVSRMLKRMRSGEHTSELQLRQYLVFRLLIGKKKGRTVSAS